MSEEAMTAINAIVILLLMAAGLVLILAQQEIDVIDHFRLV